ncbi:MAG: ABC transporter substrate-binding protein [Faecousia sp.]
MKQIIKSTVALLLVAVMCFGLVACGNDPVEDPNQNQNQIPGPIDIPTNPQETVPTMPQSGSFLDNVEGLPATLDNPNISIVYWYNEKQYQYDTSKKADVYDPILEAIPYFEEKYGGEVNVIYADWNNMLSTVISLQQSNEAPDLFEIYDETLYNVILSGVAMDISDYVTEKDMGYYDIRQDTFQWEGRTYGIPLKPYTMYIMFNRDLFTLEGLKAPDEMFRDGEWNWATFRDVCKKLTKTVDGEVTQLAFGSWEEDILRFMYANNGTLLNVDTATGTVTSNLGSPNTQATLDYLKDLMGCFVFGNDMFGWFDNGNLAMIRGKEFPVELPFDVGMVPFPVGDNFDGKALAVYPQGMAVPNGAQNPEGAVAFMRIVNELQQVVGNQKEASRIGQENYDMIYAEDVKLVYNYDKGLNDIGTILATIVNYLNDGVPAATINANLESQINSEIELRYGK